jgi:hypothetical protein
MPSDRAVVVRCEQPPERRFDAEHREGVPGDIVAEHRPDFVPGPDLEVEPGDREHRAEHAVAVAQLLEQRIIRARAPAALTGMGDDHELLGMLHGKGAQQHRLDDAEDRRVGADGCSERGDDQRGGERRLAQRACGMADVVNK